jgi:hypothetical protein
MIEVTLLADEDAEGAVEQLRQTLQERVEEVL